jgi:hypothetical protein
VNHSENSIKKKVKKKIMEAAAEDLEMAMDQPEEIKEDTPL